MPRTGGKEPKPKTGVGLRESRFIFDVFPEAGMVRSLKMSCFLLVKSKLRLGLQERQKTGSHSDQERSHMVASVRHFGYSRSSGLAPGCVF